MTIPAIGSTASTGAALHLWQTALALGDGSASCLRPSITHEDATAILLALTHFSTFDQFQAVPDSRPAADIAIAILTQTLLHELPRNSHE